MATNDEAYGDALAAIRPTPTYEIAVPSYRRADTLASRTLATLARLGADTDRITVFVADNTEAEIYRATVDVRVVVGRPGLDACRKWYANEHYPAGTRILNIDDDVDDLLAVNGKKLVAWDGTLDTLTAIGWGICDGIGAKLWGVASAANAFYMADEAVAGLRYLCGIMFGSIAGDPASMDPATPAVSSGADFERSIRSYLQYGSVVRINWVAPKTTYFGSGGMQAELGGKDARAIDHAAQLRAIVLRYPTLAKLVRKANGVPNVRLTPKTVVRLPRSSLERVLLQSEVRSSNGSRRRAAPGRRAGSSNTRAR